MGKHSIHYKVLLPVNYNFVVTVVLVMSGVL